MLARAPAGCCRPRQRAAAKAVKHPTGPRIEIRLKAPQLVKRQAQTCCFCPAGQVGACPPTETTCLQPEGGTAAGGRAGLDGPKGKTLDLYPSMMLLQGPAADSAPQQSTSTLAQGSAERPFLTKRCSKRGARPSSGVELTGAGHTACSLWR